MRVLLISDGVVANLLKAKSLESVQRFHPGCEVLDADASGGGIGWRWDGQTLTPPPRWPSLAEGKRDVLASLAAVFEQHMEGLKAGYPTGEVESWGQQASEAQAWTSNSRSPTPLLSALAAARGVTLAEQAAKVMAKAQAHAAQAGALIGHRQQLQEAIQAVDNIEALAAIEVTTGWQSPQ